MFNTKRIQENIDITNKNFKFIKESLTKLEDIVGANASKFNDLIDWKNSLIPCSTCKCLIRKEDAIKGKSEIVMKTDFSRLDHTHNNFVEEETIFTPYHCLRCKPKK